MSQNPAALRGNIRYVGPEFIPTRDPREGLAQAIAVCDV
jgi:hypothetical protein